MASDASRNFAVEVKGRAMDNTNTPSRKKSGRRSLSDRLRFRPRAFSASTAAAGNAAGRLSKVSSATALMEPRDSVATSGESEASTMGASPIVERVLVSRETRSCSTSACFAAGAYYSAASSSRHRHRRLPPGGYEREAASPPTATTPVGRGMTDVGAGLRQSGRESGQIKVMFRRHEFSSTRGKGLGLTVSPAKDVGVTGSVARGARIEESEGCAQRAPLQQASTPLRPGDLLAEVNGQDVRRLPFSEVLRLLNAPTPHVITTTAPSTTTTIGSMFGSSSNSGSPARPHPVHPGGNLSKIRVRGSLSSAAIGPRTPGSGNNGQCTAPPSTNRSRAPAASTPPSPAALAPLSPLARPGSPLRSGGSSTKTPRGIAPLLTDLRRKSWRGKFSSRWGGGGGGSKKDRARVRDSKTCTGAASFFSSTEATPTNTALFSSKQAPSLDPWGAGDTPGGKQSRIHRTRSMINSTLGRMSPRGMLSPWAAEALGAKAFNVVPAVPPPPATPQTPAGAPPSPSGTASPELALDARPGSPAPRLTVKSMASLSPRGSLREQREPAQSGGGVGGAGRSGSKLRYSLSLPQSDRWFGGADSEEEEEEEDEDEDEDEDEYSVSRQLSRETMMSSSSAFFPSDSEDDFVVEGEREEETEEEEEQQVHKHRRRRHGRPLGSRNGMSVDVAGIGRQLARSTDSSGQDQGPGDVVREQADTAEVPLGEREEEEIVALSSYLACAERGWPWAGQDVLWAEYVSLNGQHRWVRTENCRHALLLVPGTLYLLEFPKEAVTRYMSNGLSTRSRGSWFVSLNASDLSHLSVPLTPKEPRPTTVAVTSPSPPRRSSSAAKSRAFSNRFETGSGMILHKKGRGGACAWVECRSAASRDALVDVVSTWAQHPETKTKGKVQGAPPLRVELASVPQLSSETVGGGRRGRKMATLTDERQKCPLW